MTFEKAFLHREVYKREALISKIKKSFSSGWTCSPLDLSSLLYHFLNSDQKNLIRVTVTRKRKREIGLIVSAKYDCYRNDKGTSSVSDEGLKKRKSKNKTLEIDHQKTHFYRKFAFIE